MKNPVICKNCLAENPLYSHICSKCKYFLRDKVHNIDIWTTIEQIIESPAKAFLKIIFAEHKNFIVFLTIFFALRILVLSRFTSLFFADSSISAAPIIISYLITLTASAFIYIILSYLSSIILKRWEYIVRFKDIYSLNIYSNIPNILALFILLPIELIVFGNYLFSNNPSPFQVKAELAYILAAFEGGILLWSFILNYKAIKTLTDNNTISLLTSLLHLLFFITLIIGLSLTVF